ncbi:MAG TPA: hypothetical protein VMR75_01515, partial [Candidatus Saccharimonadales bacterium]|nr:hypothetical protein [Candidatus Saccharimonadales bacterium]
MNRTTRTIPGLKAVIRWLRYQAKTQPARDNRSPQAVQEDTARSMKLNRVHAIMFAVLGLACILA